MKFQQISLLSLLAIVAGVAVSISHVFTSVRLSRANVELAALRQRLELLPVDDTAPIAIRRLPSTDQYVHRWAIRVPRDEPFILAANWGDLALADVCNIESPTVQTFKLDLDPATNEGTVVFRVLADDEDPSPGVLRFEVGDKHSTFKIPPTITALWMGEASVRSESVGDGVATRSLMSPIQIFGIEATGKKRPRFVRGSKKTQQPHPLS